MSAARELFLDRGYSETPMSHVADAVGIANAAVYWYFPTKDHLLAEVFRQSVVAEVKRLETGPADPFDRLIKGLVDMRAYRKLHMTIHDRMSHAEVVVGAHDRLIAWIRETVTEGLRYHGFDPAEEQELVELVLVVFEGTNIPGVRTRAATDMIQVLLDRVVLTDAAADTVA